MFPVIQVPDDAAELPEALGSKRKFWFSWNDGRYLFKETTEGTGEDWSEKVAAELATSLGIPHADYHLARYRGRRGVVSPNFVSRRSRLVHGNELLAKIESNYEVKKVFHNRRHTLRIVLKVLKENSTNPPIGFESFRAVEAAVDCFAGYIMLDAWIANQDRHHENWGLILTQDSTVHLAPSFDHASSLGRNENDEVRRNRLTTKDKGRSMQRFVQRARSAFYSSPSSRKPMTTLEAFQHVARLRVAAAEAWLGRLKQVSSAEVESIFSKIPSGWISSDAIAFATKVLELNRERLLGL